MGILLYTVFRVLYEKPGKENTLDAQLPYILVMLRFAGYLFLILLAWSLLSTLLSWLWLRYRSRTKKILHIAFTEKNGVQYLEAELEDAVRPFLGFIKLRLIDDDFSMPAKHPLSASRFKKRSLRRQSIAGSSPIQLPDIRHYHIRYGILFVEDMFHLLSLPLRQHVESRFFQAPRRQNEDTGPLHPQRTEETDIRIEQLRQVEGELLNYKDFESGDDIRRIVWKVFAKNRDLIVRVPERMEPYASHLYLYASFYDHLNIGRNAYADEMLNRYKERVWSVYRKLCEQEWQIRFIPDQDLRDTDHLHETERVQHIISSSDWQRDTTLKSYFDVRKGSVLLVHSLSNAGELTDLLQEQQQGPEIIFVKLSDTFRYPLALHWLRKLFFLPPPDRLSKLRGTWFFSPLRRKLLKNEQAISRILQEWR